MSRSPSRGRVKRTSSSQGIVAGNQRAALGGESRLLRFAKAIYDGPSLLRAAYWLTDRCFAKVDSRGKDFVVRLTPTVGDVDMDRLCSEMTNRALDEVLRRKIERKTMRIRNLIMAHALSEASYINRDLEQVSVGEDPLGIMKSPAESR